MSRWKMDKMTAIQMAVPNPSMLKLSPIKLEVIISVMALMTKRNNPSESTVTGSVKMIKNGFTKILSKDKIILATIAAPKPSIYTLPRPGRMPESKYPAMTIKSNALTKILTIHLSI
ncbi:hypothetical protein C883_3420 [Bacillus stratosphericus LAMA 585]|nr:hypothetical protein C883_3420 [Bacillus stratosphericus LAMA 585]